MTNEQLGLIGVVIGGFISFVVSMIFFILKRYLDNEQNFKSQVRQDVSDLQDEVSEIKTDVAVLKNNVR